MAGKNRYHITGQIFFYDYNDMWFDEFLGKEVPRMVEQPRIDAVVEADSNMEALDIAVGLRCRAAGQWQCYRCGGADLVPPDTPLHDGIPEEG